VEQRVNWFQTSRQTPPSLVSQKGLPRGRDRANADRRMHQKRALVEPSPTHIWNDCRSKVQAVRHGMTMAWEGLARSPVRRRCRRPRRRLSGWGTVRPSARDRIEGPASPGGSSVSRLFAFRRRLLPQDSRTDAAMASVRMSDLCSSNPSARGMTGNEGSGSEAMRDTWTTSMHDVAINSGER
jgi:hypothetical protein